MGQKEIALRGNEVTKPRSNAYSWIVWYRYMSGYKVRECDTLAEALLIIAPYIAEVNYGGLRWIDPYSEEHPLSVALAYDGNVLYNWNTPDHFLFEVTSKVGRLINVSC